jgi:zinc/manganese transport system substrate-binding protein
MAATIAERLENLDPANGDEYRTAAAAFIRKVDQAMFGAEAVTGMDPEALWRQQTEGRLEGSGEGWHTRMAAFKGAQVVTYHRSWTYFLQRFGLVSVGELEAKPGISPSPGHLKSLIATIREKQVPVLIAASFKGNRAPNLVVSKTGIKLVKVPYSTGGSDEAADYIAMIDNLVTKVAAALSGEEAK